MSSLCQLKDNTLASGSYDDTIKIWDTFAGTFQRSWAAGQRYGYTLFQLKDGTLASGGYSGSVKLWNPNSGLLIKQLATPDRTFSLAELSNGNIVVGSTDSAVQIWNPFSYILVSKLTGHTGSIKFVVVLQDDSIVSGSDDMKIKVWNPDGTLSRTLSSHTGSVINLVVLKDWRLASYGPYQIKIWNLYTGALLRTIGVEACSGIVDLLDDTIACSYSSDIKIYSMTNGTLVKSFQTHNIVAMIIKNYIRK